MLGAGERATTKQAGARATFEEVGWHFPCLRAAGGGGVNWKLGERHLRMAGR